MAFEIVPALDLSHGRLAQLTDRGLVSVEAFGGEPVSAAAGFLDRGARRVHVVDLDLATDGAAGNLGIISQVAALGVEVQASGGVRDLSEVAELRAAGAMKVVIGSGALADRASLEELLSLEAEHLIVGIEVEGARISSRGRSRVNLPLEETFAWVGDIGARAFLLTMVHHVGTLEGPDLRAAEALIGLGRPVLVAGGISTMEHIEQVQRLGASGVVVGRAALEGRLDLRAAIARFDTRS